MARRAGTMRGDGAIQRHLDIALRSDRRGWVGSRGGGIVHRPGEDAAALLPAGHQGRVVRVGCAAQAADLVRLIQLQMADVIDLLGRVHDVADATGDAQIEWLLLVGLVAAGHIAADDEGQTVIGEVLAELLDIDSGLAERIQLGLFERRRERGGIVRGRISTGLSSQSVPVH